MSVLSHCLPLLDGCVVTLVDFSGNCGYFNGPPPTNTFAIGVTLTNPCGPLTGTITYYLDYSSCDNPDPSAGPWVLQASYGPTAISVPPGPGWVDTGALFAGIPFDAGWCRMRGRAVAVVGGTTYTWSYLDYICSTT